MPSYDSELFNVSPYYDDFDSDKKFLRMLFRPGYSVQSRELTQLQTILQNQIEKFGDHIFKDGSVIIGGQITTQTLNFVRIQPQTISQTPAKTLTAEDIVGYNLIQRDSNDNVVAKAKVVDFLSAYSVDDNYAVAVVSYMSGNEFSAGVTLECDTPNLLYTKTSPSSTEVPHKGTCQTVAVAEGIFYVNGFFVKTKNQIQSAYTVANQIRNFNNPTGSMGFDLKQVIVTERDDYTLRDPANGSYNYNAPGSHRYRIDLDLLFVDLGDTPNFFELVRYDSGNVIKKFDQTQYPELVKVFAQRTYDQNGNYIIKPFSVTMKEKDDTTLFAEIGSGKAYVYGHEYESAFKDRVEIPRGRETSQFTEVAIQNRFDNYVVGKYKTQLPNGTGENHTDINPLLNGNAGVNPIVVYGTTGGPLGVTGYLNFGFSGAVFNALMHKMEFTSGLNDSVFTATGNTGVEVRAYLSSITVRREPTSTNQNINLNLYSINQETGVSKKLLFDLNTLRDSGVAGSLLPQINNFNNQSLIYTLNGDSPTTVIKDNDEISYIHTVYRSFDVIPTNNTPSVSADLDSSFKWCTSQGAIPNANQEFNIDSGDEYYLVFTATNQFSVGPNLIGEILRIVLPSVENRSTNNYTIVYPNAKITANGTNIQFTKPLKPGQYTLIGKVKADNQTLINSTNKIRTKTLTTVSETLSSTSETNRRTLNNTDSYVSGSSIFSVSFRLNKADVYKINSIVDSSGSDISYKFEFDNGQRDNLYQLARLYVKPKYQADFASPTSNVSYNFTINYSYFEHSGYGPFIKESYENSGISYENIPVFINPNNGKSINLVNAIDFRPVQTILKYRKRGTTQISENPVFLDNVPIFGYIGGYVTDNYTIESNYTAYLPRIDKIVISKNIAADDITTTIRRVPGVASDSPQTPEDLNESMTLSILSIPAYTYNATDVKAEYVGNNRFTMKDISKMSKRVDNLEQHIIISDIESNVVYRDIKKSNGSDAIKRAVLVDSFNGHSVGDVLNPDYRCSVDIERGELKPSFDSHAYSMEYTENASGITLTTDNILCETYTRYSTPVVEQTKASARTEVNSFGFPNWVGNMVVTPHGDFWFDRDFRPVVKYNEDGVNDAWVAANIDGLNGHGTQWNDWESIWSGLSVEATDAESKKNSEFFSRSREKSNFDSIDKKFYNKDGILRETDPVDSNKKIYQVDFRKKEYYTNISTDTVVNTSVVPFMRDQIVVFNAYNMKPGTQVWVFIDNVDMSDLCYRYSDNGVTFDIVTSSLGSITGPFMTNDKDGSLTNVVVAIPRGIFEVGEKLIRVIDDPNNNVENATTVAEAVFFCNGFKEQNVLDIQSIRPPEIRKQTPNSNKIVSTPLFRSKNINTIKYNNWVDPMAQTFEIREDLYPNGLFAESVDIFVATKDEELPITVKLCPVINGIPHTSVVLPFSTVVKNPVGITADSTTPVATTFKFSTPVFLSPGEYAIILHTNSTRYSVFTAKIGEDDITTGERISSTLSTGSLFKSQNNSENSGDKNTDMMFKLHRCQFNTTATGERIFEIQTVSEGTTYSDAIENIAVIQPNLFVFNPEDVSMTGVVEVDSRTYSFSNSRNISLLEVLDKIDDGSVVVYQLTARNNSNGINTFMVDMDKTNLVAASYIIQNGPAIQTERNPYSYIPKRKRLKRGASGIATHTLFNKNRSGKLIFRSIAELGDRPIDPANPSSDGLVGTGLTKRGRKKWTYASRLFVPQFIANSLEDNPVANIEEDKNARYITRYVTIPNGVTAKELKVYFDGNIPNGSSVQVHAKTFDSTRFSQNADVQPYRLLTQESTSLFQSLNTVNSEYSQNVYDFREASYSLVAPADFNTFIVKICMYSTNKVKVPTIKNLRIVAIS